MLGNSVIDSCCTLHVHINLSAAFLACSATAICKVSAATALGFSSPWQAVPCYFDTYETHCSTMASSVSLSQHGWAQTLTSWTGSFVVFDLLSSCVSCHAWRKSCGDFSSFGPARKKIRMQIPIGLSVIPPTHFLQRQASKGPNCLCHLMSLSFSFPLPFSRSFSFSRFSCQDSSLEENMFVRSSHQTKLRINVSQEF